MNIHFLFIIKSYDVGMDGPGCTYDHEGWTVCTYNHERMVGDCNIISMDRCFRSNIQYMYYIICANKYHGTNNDL